MNGVAYGTGTGHSKKEAEQQAAAAAFAAIQLLPEPSVDSTGTAG